METGLKLPVTANGGDPKLTAAEQVPEIVIHRCRFSNSQNANKLFRALNC